MFVLTVMLVAIFWMDRLVGCGKIGWVWYTCMLVFCLTRLPNISSRPELQTIINNMCHCTLVALVLSMQYSDLPFVLCRCDKSDRAFSTHLPKTWWLTRKVHLETLSFIFLHAHPSHFICFVNRQRMGRSPAGK